MSLELADIIAGVVAEFQGRGARVSERSKRQGDTSERPFFAGRVLWLWYIPGVAKS